MKRHVVLAAFAAALLAACGGGGGGGQLPTPAAPVAEVPDEASGSVRTLIGWLAGLASENRAEPYAMGRFAPQRPDDDEPEELS